MTPAARMQTAIEVLDQVLAGQMAEAALLRWARASRFAGSGDRAAVRDLVFLALRRMRSFGALGGGLSGRALMLGLCREEGTDPAALFTGARHAPASLTQQEVAAGAAASGDDALDLPEWILPRWRAALGPDADRLALAMRERAPVWLRVNALRTEPAQAVTALAEDGIEVEPSGLLPCALQVLKGARGLAGSRAYREGLVELQDLSPQLACAMLPVGGTALDFCAGGGGKALALAARGAARVTAHDIDAGRMSDLPARAQRAGATIHIARPGKVSGRFDLVLTDVPCSGSGTWRRTPDAKWRFSPPDLDRLLHAQARIMDQGAGFVAPGGYLAYMTCSLLEEENGAQLRGFLSRQPGFVLAEERRFTPLDASDGFYAALLRRN